MYPYSEHKTLYSAIFVSLIFSHENKKLVETSIMAKFLNKITD